MDLTSITAALTSIKSAIDIAKFIEDSGSSLQNLVGYRSVEKRVNWKF